MTKTTGSGLSISRGQYAGFRRRLLASFVDAFILTLIGITIQTALGGNITLQGIDTLEELQQMQNSTSYSLVSIISMLVGVAYWLIFYVNYDGATPGKRLMAVKVVREDGSDLTYPVAFVRYLGMFVSAFLFFLGYFWIIWDKRKQGFHDKIAKTLVVKTDAKPRTFLAIVISLMSVLLFIGFVGIVGYRGYQLGMLQTTNRTGTFTGKTINQYREEMNPEARVHYDKSMQLFNDIKANQNDPVQVKIINDENIAELKIAAELDPMNPEIWYQLGSAYTWVSSTSTIEDSVEAFRKAEEIEPNNVVYINGVGDALILSGMYEDAILQFQKTFRITDNSGFANLSVANAYARLGIKESAKEHYQKAIAIFTTENKDGSYDNFILQAKQGLAAVSQ